MAEPETPAAAEPARKFKKPPRRKVSTPTILQMEAVECGAAALAMVLAYFGRWVPLEELRQECGVSRDGSKANNVLRAARKYGLEAKGYKYSELEKLYELQFPAILFWNFNHFVVLDGFKGEQGRPERSGAGPARDHDDRARRLVLGRRAHVQGRSGVQEGGRVAQMMPALRRRLVGSEGALLYTMICGLLLVIPGLIIPTFTRVFIDDYLLAGQAWLVKPLLWAMAATVVVHGLLTWLQKRALLRLETKLALVTSSRFFTHILQLPAAYFGQRFSGEIGSRVAINDRVAQMVSGRLAGDGHRQPDDRVLRGVDVRLRREADAGRHRHRPAEHRRDQARGPRRIDGSRRLMQDRGKLTGVAMDGIQMIETIKATGSEAEFFARWAGYYAKTINNEQFLQVLGSDGSTAVPPLVQTDVDRRGAGDRRHQGHAGRPDDRHARRLPDPALELHASAHRLRPVRVGHAGTAGGHEPARRRAAVPGRRPVQADARGPDRSIRRS